MDTILIIGTGQIGKATLFRLLQKRPKKVIVHNLTRQESQDCIKLFRSSFKGTKFVESHGNIFMPHSLKDLTREELLMTIGVYSIIAAVTTVLAICLLVFIAEREGHKEELKNLLVKPEGAKRRVTPALVTALVIAFLYMLLEAVLAALV